MRNFGIKFKETSDAILGAGNKSHQSKAAKSKAIMRIVISFVLLSISVYFVYLHEGASQDIAEFIIGAVVGFWFG